MVHVAKQWGCLLQFGSLGCAEVAVAAVVAAVVLMVAWVPSSMDCSAAARLIQTCIRLLELINALITVLHQQ